MYQLRPCVYTTTDLNLSIHLQNFAYGFVYVLIEVCPSIYIHTYNIKSTHLSIQTHLSSPLNLSIHLYTIHPYTQPLTYPYIDLYIHISIYPYIYHIAGKLKKTPLIMCPLWGNLKIFSILAI